jgi:hypothetical protein
LSRRPRRTTEYERKLKSEERRAIIYLGYFTSAIALRIEYQREVELGKTPFVNLFCNSPVHISPFSWYRLLTL